MNSANKKNSPRRLRKAERQDLILSIIEDKPTIRVGQLTAELGVSTETIRRDLAEMDKAGRINRTYGGAIRSQRFEPHLSERLQLHNYERKEIAQKALEEIGDAAAILIGGGATVQLFARALHSIDRPLTVITMAQSIAPELATNPQLQIVLLPGLYDGNEGIVTGADTINAIARYHAPIAVLGASGIDPLGVTEAMVTASQVYAAAVEHSDRQLILADHSKFSRRALTLVSPWQSGMTLCTNQTPPQEILMAMTRSGAQLRIS